jgi:uncharacterized membrane protein YfcA
MINSDMRGQRWRMSLLEAATQAAIGVPIGFCVVYGVSRFGMSPAATAVTTSSVMFLINTSRGYFVRRGFNRMGRK